MTGFYPFIIIKVTSALKDSKDMWKTQELQQNFFFLRVMIQGFLTIP